SQEQAVRGDLGLGRILPKGAREQHGEPHEGRKDTVRPAVPGRAPSSALTHRWGTRHNRAHVDGRDDRGVAPGLAEPGVAARLNARTDRTTARTPGPGSGVSSCGEGGTLAARLQMLPDRETFDALSREWPLVPVWTELLSDVS